MTFAAAPRRAWRRPIPSLRFRAGERVRLVLKNEAPGLLHDVAIPGVGRRTSTRSGRRDAPRSPSRCRADGRTGREYRCRPHSEMMSGRGRGRADIRNVAARGRYDRARALPRFHVARAQAATTSARCLRRSPIATTSSPSCCRSGAIGRGSGGSSAKRGLQRGERVLDLACGTGDIAFEAARRGRGRRRTRCHDADDRARARQGGRGAGRAPPRFLVGDMMALPFRRRGVDVVTTGYGLRNVPDLADAARRDCARAAARRPAAVARLQPSAIGR